MSTRIVKTATTQQQCIEELARTPIAKLAVMRVADLRHAVRQCGITHIDELTPVARATKEQLITSIEDLTRKQRAIDVAAPEVNTLDEDDIKTLEVVEQSADRGMAGDYAEVIWQVVENYAVMGTEEARPGTVASNVINSILTAKSLNNEMLLLADRTKLDMIKGVLSILKSKVVTYRKTHRLSAAQSMRLDSSYNTVRNTLANDERRIALVKSDAQLREYSEQHRQTSVTVVNPDKAIYASYRLLKSNQAEWRPRDWKNVAISLTMTTGRRQAEVLGEGTRFTHVSHSQFDTRPAHLANVPITHLVWFSGHLKDKSDSNYQHGTYMIPTLVPAELVVGAHEWLRSIGKVADPKKVNKTWAPEVVDTVRKFFVDYMPEVPESIEREGYKPMSMRSFHRLRELYNLASAKAYAPSNYSRTQYMALVMGHNPSLRARGTTALYEADFNLSGNTQGWIQE